MKKILFCLCFTLALLVSIDTICYSKGGGGGGGRSSVSSSRSSTSVSKPSVSTKPSSSTSKPSTSTVTKPSTSSTVSSQKKDEDKKKEEELKARRDRTTNNYYTRNESSSGIGSFLGGAALGAILYSTFDDDPSPKESLANATEDDIKTANDNLAASQITPQEDTQEESLNSSEVEKAAIIILATILFAGMGCVAISYVRRNRN